MSSITYDRVDRLCQHINALKDVLGEVPTSQDVDEVVDAVLQNVSLESNGQYDGDVDDVDVSLSSRHRTVALKTLEEKIGATSTGISGVRDSLVEDLLDLFHQDLENGNEMQVEPSEWIDFSGDICRKEVVQGCLEHIDEQSPYFSQMCSTFKRHVFYRDVFEVFASLWHVEPARMLPWRERLLDIYATPEVSRQQLASQYFSKLWQNHALRSANEPTELVIGLRHEEMCQQFAQLGAECKWTSINLSLLLSNNSSWSEEEKAADFAKKLRALCALHPTSATVLSSLSEVEIPTSSQSWLKQINDDTGRLNHASSRLGHQKQALLRLSERSAVCFPALQIIMRSFDSMIGSPNALWEKAVLEVCNELASSQLSPSSRPSLPRKM